VFIRPNGDLVTTRAITEIQSEKPELEVMTSRVDRIRKDIEAGREIYNHEIGLRPCNGSP
jgi:hypothetical protein